METYVGHVRTPADAIKLFEACRLGLLPRVQRRLSEKERQSIKSGSVFVWDEREAGMRRWTDGKSWSASRVSGSFLTYREMEGKRGGGSFVPPPVRRVPGKTPDSGRGSDEDMDLDGEGPDGYRYKPDGLMKQSFSITTSSGQHLHLISYFARPHANAPDLLQPTTDPALRHIVPVKGMYPESTVHEQAQGPAVTRAPMQSAYMTSPGHAGHPAHGPPRPPYPYQVSAGYSWPPSPVSTPPYSGYPPGMYSSALPPPPPPAAAHASPHQHPHQYSPHHPPHLQHHPSAGAAPQQTAYDRAPPPLHDSSLPPPPPSMLHQQHPSQRLPASGPPPNHISAPHYVPNPSPRMAQARQIADQQAAQHQQAQAQQIQAQQQQAAAQQAALAQRIALQVMSAQDTRPQQLPLDTRTTLPPVNISVPADRKDDRKEDRGERTPTGNGTSQTIPSISSLVHATDSPPMGSVNGVSSSSSNGPHTSNGVNGDVARKSASRHGSSSPGLKGSNGNSAENAPRDISLSKMGQGVFGNEDNRALRVLDRKFCI